MYKYLVLLALVSCSAIQPAFATRGLVKETVSVANDPPYTLTIHFDDTSVEVCYLHDFQIDSLALDATATKCVPDVIFDNGFEKVQLKENENSR
jgi:hypothetical protein